MDCVNHATCHNTGDSITARLSASFITAAKEIINLVNLWCNHRTPTRLEDLVEGIRRLHQQQIVHETLGQVISLSDMTSKVAGYRQAARFLYGTAQRFPIVRRARI